MQTFVLPSTPNSRRGITLMEVLISIGIIAIGLTSVMSLIPAGKSEAGRALVYDRAAAMAMNCLSDAISYGITRPDAFVAANSAATTIVFDHANAVSWPGVASVGSLKSAGVLAAQSNAATSPLTVMRLLTQGRDDVAYNPPATADDLPTNGFVNGIRGFEGRMTSLIAITESDGGVAPLAAGDIVTLSVVTFHNRDLATPTVSGTMYTSGLVELSSLPAGRSLKAIMRPGTVVYYVDPIASRVRFCQLSMAAVDTDTADTYVTLAGRPIPSGNVPVTVLVDSFGLAEQTVALEGPSPYGQ